MARQSHTERRDMMWPFLGIALATTGGLVLIMLAVSIAEP